MSKKDMKSKKDKNDSKDKYNILKKEKEIETKIDDGIVGLEEKLENNKKFSWLIIIGVIVIVGLLVGILVGFKLV